MKHYHLKPCIKCGAVDRYADGRCKPCLRKRTIAYSEAHPERKKAYGLAWQKRNPGIVNAHWAKRKAAKIQATPIWFETEQVAELYKQASDITKDTGKRQNVDHIVPLLSNKVCGLHCLANLRIIPEQENHSKGNRHWPNMQESP